MFWDYGDSGRMPDSPGDRDWDDTTADEQGNLDDDADTGND